MEKKTRIKSSGLERLTVEHLKLEKKIPLTKNYTYSQLLITVRESLFQESSDSFEYADYKTSYRLLV